MSNILIIGAGGVSQVATVKCAMNSDVFTNITLASRTKSKCDAIAKFIKDRLGVQINTAQIDADDTAAVVELIKQTKADLLLNVALPYLEEYLKSYADDEFAKMLASSLKEGTLKIEP